jgi:hypothetical protein
MIKGKVMSENRRKGFANSKSLVSIPPEKAPVEMEHFMHYSAGGDQEQQPVSTTPALEVLHHGKAFEQVDPYTLEIINSLFPTHSSGLEFTARLLRYATIKQNVLPGLEDLGEYVAVISTRTIRTLASMIGWGYDTTHKYIVTFCAVGLLHRFKSDNERQLVFPLKRYTLPQTLNALEQLITKSRPKVQQFARKVRDRFVKLIRTAMPKVAPQPTVELSECDPRLIKTLFAPTLAVLQSEGLDATTGQNIAARLLKEVIGKFVLPLDVIKEPSTANTPNDGFHMPAPSQKYPDPSQSPSESSHISTESTSDGRLFTQDTYTTDKPQTNKGYSEEETATKYQAEEQKVSSSAIYDDTQSSDGRLFTQSSTQTLLDIYATGLNEIDWEAVGIPVDLISQLYDQIRYHYDKLASRGLLNSLKGYFWRSIEKQNIRRLAEDYKLDFVFTYNTIMHYTNRSDLLLTELSDHSPVYQQPEDSFSTPVYQQPEDSFSFEGYNQRKYKSYPRAYRSTRKRVNNAQTETIHGSSVTYNEYHQSEIVEDSNITEYPYNQTSRDTCIVDSNLQKSTANVDSPENEYPETTADKPTRETGIPLELDEEEELAGMRPILEAMTQEELTTYKTRRKAVKAWRAQGEQFAREEREKYLKIPEKLDSKSYSETFLRNYVTEDIITLINNIYNNITLRNELGRFFADVFDHNQIGETEKWYTKLLSECNAEQLCSGFIDTVVLLHRPTKFPIKQPGGFFNKRCEKSKQDGLSASTRKRMKMYGSMKYEDLVNALFEQAKSGRQSSNTQD